MSSYHGGQDNNIVIKLIEDFSVTTNMIGPNKNGLEIIKLNLDEINHYPPANLEPFKSNLSNFIFKNKKMNIILGNGASELIDILIRKLIDLNNYKTFHIINDIQYMEYYNSCKRYNLKNVNLNKADIICLVNPNNPTGKFYNIDSIKTIINNIKNNSSIIIDESMIFWLGPKWRENSFSSLQNFIENIKKERNIDVFIMMSWTKIFSCTGLRYGSLITNNNTVYHNILNNQVPWTVNILALKYIDYCITDEHYLNLTWRETIKIRTYMIDWIKEHFSSWTIYGEEYQSWILIDTHNENTAENIYYATKYNGTPIRWLKFGYNQPTFIRIAVRCIESVNILFNCILKTKKNILSNLLNLSYYNIDSSIIIDFKNINVNEIKIHEEYIIENHKNLMKYLNVNEKIVLPAIVLCHKTYTLIDGHHRLSILKKLGFTEIPCLLIDYKHNSIIVNEDNLSITKEIVIETAINNKTLPPKSTNHKIINKENKNFPLVIISPMIFLDNISFFN